MPERCLAQKVGSCLGCNVQEIAMSRLRRNGQKSKEDLLQVFSRENCPDGLGVQIPREGKPPYFVR